MAKMPVQMQVLMDQFCINPEWTFSTKIKIAKQIGMTLNQVSKWNWDQRKKLGLRTDRNRFKQEK